MANEGFDPVKIAWQEYVRGDQSDEAAYNLAWALLSCGGYAYPPTLHLDFYADQLTEAAGDKDFLNVYIPGAADHMMLSVVHQVLGSRYDLKVTVADRQQLSLALNRIYAEQHQLSVTLRQMDFTDTSHACADESLYDIIVADRILDFLPDKSMVLRTWRENLAYNGSIITVCSLGQPDEMLERRFGPWFTVQSYFPKLKLLSHVSLIAIQRGIPLSIIPRLKRGLEKVARKHTSKSADELVPLFIESGLHPTLISQRPVRTNLGELSEELALEITAR